MSLYIEARIRADLDVLWERTQDPAQHQRWDLRFTEIDYLPQTPGEPRRFRYATRVLPGLTVAGTGVSAGEKRRPDGTRTSALRFSSAHPLSLLAEGGGYWRYVPDGDADGGGVRFVTGYDYRPRWGRFGALADRLAFRPLMGWATAWSFDRLRLWLERGVSPERSLLSALAEVLLRLGCVVAVALVSPTAGVLVGVLAALLRPLPTTPAARRCRREPPPRARAPKILDTLTAPAPAPAPALAPAPQESR
ncbi:hypothetical protein ACX6XY_28640 [Streptomyces sp. O3]